MADSKWLEKVVKGFANHYRIETLYLLKERPELSVGEISAGLRTDVKNTSQHLAKMDAAGLLLKRHEGAEVRHKLTFRAEKILKFIKSLD